MKYLVQLSAIASLLFLVACERDAEISDLDETLEYTLLDKANYQGLDYYKLPNSDDYSSIPQDPRNDITDEKVTLGKLLYHETAMAIDPKDATNMHTFSCASCHHARAGFQSGLQQGIAEGGSGFGVAGERRRMTPGFEPDSMDVQPIKSPTILNTAYQEVTLWNGQFGNAPSNIGTEASWTAGTPKAVNHLGFHGVETQAIAGLTVHRMGVDTNLLDSGNYRAMFDEAFPEFTEADRYSSVTAGLAIAAYERTVLANEAPFQRWLNGDLDAMSDKEKRGAILFFSKAQCYQCHSGPALNSMDFHALGFNDLEGPLVHSAALDEATRKGRGGFTGVEADEYKFKVPQLYSLRYASFYGHGASFNSVREVIEYKNRGEKENALVPDSKLSPYFVPLNLSDEEVDELTAFVVDALDDPNLIRYEPITLPSGLCFPNNDDVSRVDRGCE